MEYVIGIVLVVIVAIIIVLLFRKRLYDQLDYYEDWKIDIVSRNVAAKLTRVKARNLEGEVKEKLETWKDEWDRILTDDLADVEELLHDAEHTADQFRITASRKFIGRLEDMLVNVEKKIDRIEKEAEGLIDTDKTNREEIEKIEPQIKQLRKRLLNERNSFDRAAAQFEKDLDEVTEDLRIYEELVEVGTYSEASEIVENVKGKIAEITEVMEVFPDLYKKCKFELPEQIDDVYKSVQEMEAQGYYLDHLHIKSAINDLQARMLDYVAALEKTETEKIEKLIPETEEQLEALYDQLEQEVLAKSFITSKSATFSQSLERLLSEFTKTKDEVEQLKKTYHFEDEDLEKYMSLEKQIKELEKRHQAFVEITEKEHASSVLRDDLTANISKLEKLDYEHDAYKKEIANLRKDELEARGQIVTMTEELSRVKRQLRLSNLPGIPDFIMTVLEEATEKNERVLMVIEKQPLDIVQLQKTLEEAKATVESALEQTNTMIEQAELTEIVIQYANRYRSSDPILAAKLSEAERLFRKAEYELALEQAAGAIGNRDPGALERIEKMYQQGVS
ncbi:MAG TPA: septation ring formation regulator EzrA [Pseudogracilibacillus sp.]|nr:septation ring formation regulator EzrA [Pseudogracilibacillus sp.]